MERAPREGHRKGIGDAPLQRHGNPDSHQRVRREATATELTVDDNGVDRAQIREMLRLTPEERLRRVQEFVESLLELRALNEERSVR